MSRMTRLGIHKAVSLIEVIVVLGILGLMIGILLPAVQLTREAAARAHSSNSLRQIALAFHHYASVSDGRLPTDTLDRGAFGFLHHYVDMLHDDGNAILFENPSDPTLRAFKATGWKGIGCYSYNYQCLRGGTNPSLRTTFADGLSNTLFLGEQYGICHSALRRWNQSTSSFAYGSLDMPMAFAVYVTPETAGEPPVTLPSQPGLTFQVRPSAQSEPWPATLPPPDTGDVSACNPQLNQTPFRGGMTAATADGAVRVIHPRVAPEVFWGAVTPAGGETLPGDW